MKTLKKVLAITLALALVLCLSGCGSFERSIMKGAKKMQELNSLHMDLTLDMSLNVGIMGENMDMDLKATNSADIQTSPKKLLMETTADVMGEKQTVYIYVEQNGDTFTAAASPDGNYWESADDIELDASAAEGLIDPKAGIALLAKYASSFEKVSAENVVGYDTVRYDGVITSDDFKELFALVDIAQLAGADVDLTEEEMAQIKEALKGPFNVPCSIWLDGKTGMIIRYDIDLTEMIGSIIETMLAQELVGTEAEELGLEIKVNNMKLSTVMSQFDAVEEIVRPEF